MEGAASENGDSAQRHTSCVGDSRTNAIADHGIRTGVRRSLETHYGMFCVHQSHGNERSSRDVEL